MNDYYFDREEALYEMYEDSLNTFEEDQEDQEEDPSLSAADRNPSLRWPNESLFLLPRPRFHSHLLRFYCSYR